MLHIGSHLGERAEEDKLTKIGNTEMTKLTSTDDSSAVPY